MSNSLAATDDEELLERLRLGDSLAFEELVRTYGPSLLRMARRLMRTEDDARDAVQDAFVSVFRSIGTFDAASRLTTWLHRVALNSCLMRLRAQRRRPEESIEALLPRFLEDGHQERPGAGWPLQPDQDYERAQTSRLIRDCIGSLPDAYRVVLLLRELEQHSTEETAEILGITANAVKIRLHRARQALRTLLDPHMSRTRP